MKFHLWGLALVLFAATAVSGCGARGTESRLLAGRSAQSSMGLPAVDGQGGTTGGNPTAIGMGLAGFNPAVHPDIKSFQFCVDKAKFTIVGTTVQLTVSG